MAKVAAAPAQEESLLILDESTLSTIEPVNVDAEESSQAIPEESMQNGEGGTKREEERRKRERKTKEKV